MKKHQFTIRQVLIAIACILSSFVSAQESAEQVFTGNPHPFICTDYTQGKVFVVNEQGKIEWEYAAKDCNDVWVLPNGNFLFNTGHGVKEVTRDKKVVFEYNSASEIYACQRLANGNTFVVENNTGRILELSQSGEIVKEVRVLAEGKDGGHIYIRNSRKLDNGNYLLTYLGEKSVREFDSNGKLVREIPVSGGAHSVIRLPNGNTLISCGDIDGGTPRIIEVDPKGDIVWQVLPSDIPDMDLKFMTGMQRLPNGNTVITNWLGHHQESKKPHIIEVTPDKKVVWTFQDHINMITVSSVQLLDFEGDVTKGEILH